MQLHDCKEFCSIFLDFSLINTVNHNFLIKKLDHYAIRGVTKDWFTSYLTNRYQFVDSQQLAVVDSFCYLGDNISAGGGCEAATVTRIRAAWGKFQELLPILGSIFTVHVAEFTAVVSGVQCFMHVSAGL